MARFNYIASLALVVLSLSGCGGGGGGGGGGGDSPADTSSAQTPVTTTTATEATPDPVAPTLSLSSTAPNDNLASEPTSVTASSTRISTYCGYSTGSSRITGTVSSVHDGDTITVAGNSVRLDSIDAPELGQAYGTQSRDNLAAMVSGQSVTVTYAKKDKYGRVVGTVFKSDCTQVNMRQVSTGSAWYYEAYKCEIGSDLRNSYAAAQESAKSGGLGLWASAAVAPWMYRNGVEAAVPNSCSGGDSPSWGTVTSDTAILPVITTPSPDTGTNTGADTPTNSCYMVWVNGYRRANGTWVKGYYRRSPGCP